MSKNGSKDWVAESPGSISARLSSANASQAQTRATLGWMAIVSAMMLIACYNAYLSYDYHYFLKVAEDRNLSDNISTHSIPNALLEQSVLREYGAKLMADLRAPLTSDEVVQPGAWR
jgi:hypothetical protein